MSDLATARDLFAIEYKRINGNLPVILNQPCYKHMGSTVEITNSNVWDEEVGIQDGLGNVATVSFDSLSWEFGIEISRWIRATGRIDVWDSFDRSMLQ